MPRISIKLAIIKTMSINMFMEINYNQNLAPFEIENYKQYDSSTRINYARTTTENMSILA